MKKNCVIAKAVVYSAPFGPNPTKLTTAPTQQKLPINQDNRPDTEIFYS